MSLFEWFNNNTGFWSAVLAVISIFITVITASLAYKVGKLPYQKKLIGNVSYSENNTGGYKLCVDVINIGPACAYIKSIGVSPIVKRRKKKKELSRYLLFTMVNKSLEPGEHFSFDGNVVGRDEIFKWWDLDPNGKTRIDVYEYDKHHVIRKGFAVG